MKYYYIIIIILIIIKTLMVFFCFANWLANCCSEHNIYMTVLEKVWMYGILALKEMHWGCFGDDK